MLNIYCICKVSVCLLPSWILSCKTKTTFDIICLRVKLVSCLCTFPDSCSSQRAGLSLRTAVPCGLLIPAVWCRPCSSCSSWRRSTESSELSESPASVILGQIHKRKVDETLLLRFLLTHEETSETQNLLYIMMHLPYDFTTKLCTDSIFIPHIKKPE